MSSSIELINPKAESVRRAAALQVRLSLSRSVCPQFTDWQVNTTGAMGLANVVKGNLGVSCRVGVLCASRLIVHVKGQEEPSRCWSMARGKSK